MMKHKQIIKRKPIIAVTAAILLIAGLNVFYGLLFWLTPDQQGKLFYGKEQYSTAAQRFDNLLWKGIAYYADQDFEKAVQMFSRINTAEGYFNLGNAYAQLGEYPMAVEAYQRALDLQEDYPQARANREQIALFIPNDRDEQGGDMGATFGADEIKISDEKQEDNEDSREVQAENELTDLQMEKIWMRQVQTTPADFLKSKFYFQNEMEQMKPEPGTR